MSGSNIDVITVRDRPVRADTGLIEVIDGNTYSLGYHSLSLFLVRSHSFVCVSR
jgi:hypothetical protein